MKRHESDKRYVYTGEYWEPHGHIKRGIVLMRIGTTKKLLIQSERQLKYFRRQWGKKAESI